MFWLAAWGQMAVVRRLTLSGSLPIWWPSHLRWGGKRRAKEARPWLGTPSTNNNRGSTAPLRKQKSRKGGGGKMIHGGLSISLTNYKPADLIQNAHMYSSTRPSCHALSTVTTPQQLTHSGTETTWLPIAQNLCWCFFLTSKFTLLVFSVSKGLTEQTGLHVSFAIFFLVACKLHLGFETGYYLARMKHFASMFLWQARTIHTHVHGQQHLVLTELI